MPKKAPTPGIGLNGAEQYTYRSGMVTTFPGYKFTYGFVQVVARIPDAVGTWSALWLAASNEHWPPEIDLVEHWSAQDQYYEYYHPAGADRENGVPTLGNLMSGTPTACTGPRPRSSGISMAGFWPTLPVPRQPLPPRHLFPESPLSADHEVRTGGGQRAPSHREGSGRHQR